MGTGWKTYTAAAIMAVYGVGGYLLGLHSVDQMVTMLTTAAGLAGLRHATTTAAA